MICSGLAKSIEIIALLYLLSHKTDTTKICNGYHDKCILFAAFYRLVTIYFHAPYH